MKDGLQAMSERSIFLAALDISDTAKQTAYLDQACGSDVKLRQHIEELIAAQVKLGSFLGRPHIEVDATADVAPIAERPGSQIGPYKLLQTIGEGGMGVVFMADQHQPVRRKVALKVLKAGMDTRQVIARFEAERQALALMDHPHIARIHDGGTTADGRPYFVMELVKGIPITQFCDENQLTTRQRLELFLPICQAIQHAHQKGIIHRDIKPSNILVAEYDQQPVPKVIDFGVAKATGQELTEKTMFTALGQIVGTLEYMSPEQAKMNQLDIDTRSDIYSLGVLLYELLTGTTPFDKQRLSSAAIDEILRIIREEEPPCPSTRLSTINTLASIAAKRKTEPGRLRGLIRGELDWIVMKALEKDRNRRYETVNSLGTDIQRYLHDEPVAACPPSLTYRLSKFSRRYKAPLAVAAGFVLLLLAGIAASTWQAVRATIAERAAAANAKAARASEVAAGRERDTAKLAQQSATEERNNALAARELLRHTLYAAEMNLVQAAEESGQHARARQLLDLQRPKTGQGDLRGFEWHYWQRQLNQNRLRSVGFPQLGGRFSGAGGAQHFSHDATKLALLITRPDEVGMPLEARILTVVDGLTGRELVAPLDPIPGEQAGPNRPRVLSLSADGSRVAVATVNRGNEADDRPALISVRDAATGAELCHIEIAGPVFQIALSADGKLLAVEYGEVRSTQRTQTQSTVDIWATDSNSMAPVHTLLPLPRYQGYNRIIWSPSGARLLRQSVANEGENGRVSLRELVQIVDATSGKEMSRREFTGLEFPHPDWVWSPDGKLLAAFAVEPDNAEKHQIQLWDLESGDILATLKRKATVLNNMPKMHFSPDGQRLACVEFRDEINVWELPKLPLASSTRAIDPHLTLHAGGYVMAFAFTPDSRELMSLDKGGSLITWDVAAKVESEVGPQVVPGGLFSARFNSDATKIALSRGSDDGSVSFVWDLARNKELFRLQAVGSGYSRPAFSPDGRHVALVRESTSSTASHIVICGVQQGNVLVEIPITPPVSSSLRTRVEMAFSPNGKQLAARIAPFFTGLREVPAQIMVCDTVTGKQRISLEVTASTRGGLDYSLDGECIVLATSSKSEPLAAVYYDVVTGAQKKVITLTGLGHSNPGTCWISERHQIYGAIEDSDFVVWDLATGRERLRLPGYPDWREFTISPDGQRLALASSTGSFDSELTLWSLTSGRRLLALTLESSISAVAFSPDANRLLASVRVLKQPIQIWDATPLPEEAAK